MRNVSRAFSVTFVCLSSSVFAAEVTIKDNISGYVTAATNSLNNQTAGAGGRQILFSRHNFSQRTQITRFQALSSSTVAPAASGFSYSVRSLNSPYTELFSGSATRTSSTSYSNVTLAGNNTNFDEFSISGLVLDPGTYYVTVYASDGNAYQLAAHNSLDTEPLLAENGGVPFLAGSNFHLFTALFGSHFLDTVFDEQKSRAFSAVPAQTLQVSSLGAFTLSQLNQRLGNLQNAHFSGFNSLTSNIGSNINTNAYVSQYGGGSTGVGPFSFLSLEDTGNAVAGGGVGQLRFWADGNFTILDRETTSSYTGYNGETLGGQFGADLNVARGLTVGMSLGHTKTETSFSGNLGKSDLAGNHVSAYAQYINDNGFYSNLIYSYEMYDLDLERNAGSSGTAKANTDAHAHMVQAGIGYRLPSFKAFSSSVETRFRYTNAGIDGYTESEAGDGSLTVGGQRSDNVSVSVGLNNRYQMGRFSPYLNVFYQYNQIDLGDTVISLVEDPSLSSSQKNDPLSLGNIHFDVGLDYSVADKLMVNANYSTAFVNTDLDYHSLNLGVTYRF